MKASLSIYQDVINFFVSRGYLFAETFKRVKSVKLSDVLSVGLEEPRVFAVLPCALLRSKKGVVLDLPIPTDLKLVMDALIKDLETGPDYKSVPYAEIRRWANLKINDARSKPQREKKVTKSFRFSLDTFRQLKARAEELGITETKVLEDLVLKSRS